MSISGISSNLYNQYHTNPIQQQFQQLGTALQSGNLSAAQSDFASLQAAFSQPATTTGSASPATNSPTNNPTSQAFHQLASDLQSGNLSGAQKDFSTIQQGIQSTAGTISGHRLHHSHHGGGGVSNEEQSLLQDLGQPSPSATGQNATSSTISGVQQAYGTLAQELQQFALSGSALTSESPISFDA